MRTKISDLFSRQPQLFEMDKQVSCIRIHAKCAGAFEIEQNGGQFRLHRRLRRTLYGSLLPLHRQSFWVLQHWVAGVGRKVVAGPRASILLFANNCIRHFNHLINNLFSTL